jgi:hypothetical protein
MGLKSLSVILQRPGILLFLWLYKESEGPTTEITNLNTGQEPEIVSDQA